MSAPPVSPASERIEIKPNATRNAVLMGLACSVFTLGGVLMIVESASVKNVLVGVVAILFFGVGGGFATRRIYFRPVSMVLSREGIEQHALYGSAVIRWEDVEDMGTLAVFRGVWVRLRTYDNYLGEMSPDMAAFLANNLPFLKWLAVAIAHISLLDAPEVVKLWSKLEGAGSPQEALTSFGKLGDYAKVLLWSRERFGYEILFSWADLDRPSKEIVELMERFRKEAAPTEPALGE